MLNIKNQFPWFIHNHDLIYLDSGATSLKPQCVIDAINHYIINQSTNSHNHDSMFCFQASAILRNCRLATANLINAEANEIIFTSGATEGLNLIANAISDTICENDEIVLTYYEHGSNLLPWYKIKDDKKAKIVFASSNKFGLTAQDFTKQLTPKTKVVSFIGCSNVLGNTLPIKEITQAVKKYNPEILVCVDIAQLIPHAKCDVKQWDIDFCAYSGHKIFANTGIGVTYIKHSLQAQLRPLKYGGGMNSQLNDQTFEYAPLFEKFEGGTPNVSGIYSLLAATEYISKIGYDAIKKHEAEVHELLYANLKDCKHIKVYNWDAKSAIFAFNVIGVHSQDTAAYFGKHNFIVRSGLSCAKLLNHVIGDDGVVRASFYVYNTKEDVMRFITIIKALTKEQILNELI